MYCKDGTWNKSLKYWNISFFKLNPSKPRSQKVILNSEYIAKGEFEYGSEQKVCTSKRQITYFLMTSMDKNWIIVCSMVKYSNCEYHASQQYKTDILVTLILKPVFEVRSMRTNGSMSVWLILGRLHPLWNAILDKADTEEAAVK